MKGKNAKSNDRKKTKSAPNLNTEKGAFRDWEKLGAASARDHALPVPRRARPMPTSPSFVARRLPITDIVMIAAGLSVMAWSISQIWRG